jgi:hypothetical protein
MQRPCHPRDESFEVRTDLAHPLEQSGLTDAYNACHSRHGRRHAHRAALCDVMQDEPERDPDVMHLLSDVRYGQGACE